MDSIKTFLVRFIMADEVKDCGIMVKAYSAKQAQNIVSQMIQCVSEHCSGSLVSTEI